MGLSASRLTQELGREDSVKHTVTVLVGRLESLDSVSRRLIIGSMAFTIAPGIEIPRLREGDTVQVRYHESLARRLALAVSRLGPPRAAAWS